MSMSLKIFTAFHRKEKSIVIPTNWFEAVKNYFIHVPISYLHTVIYYVVAMDQYINLYKEFVFSKIVLKWITDSESYIYVIVTQI